MKYDDPVYKKPNHWGKILMYNNHTFNVLFPIVDIIRILPKETIISHKYAKNQNIIKLYGGQYNFLLLGIDLIKKQDYLENLKTVKFIFIFSDVQDTIADNLINYCKKTKTNLICYSNLDNIYHFYDDEIVLKIKEPENVIIKMEEIKERNTLNKLNELFPEFEILEPDNKIKNCVLEECLNTLRNSNQDVKDKKVYSTKLTFDNEIEIKKTNENKKNFKNNKIEKINEPLLSPPPPSKSSFSNFFKKN